MDVSTVTQLATAVAPQPGSQLAQQQQQQQQQEQQHEELWKDLFSNPSQWWDYRRSKTNARYPDFRHKTSKQVLWLNNKLKPVWVDSRLPTLHDARRRHSHAHHHVNSDPNHQDSMQRDSSSLDETCLQSFCRTGKLDEAIEALVSMNYPLAASTYKILLQKCGRQNALNYVRQVQAHLTLYAPAELDDSDLGRTSLVAFARCGAIEEACDILNKSQGHGVVESWNAMINACLAGDHASEALEIFPHMEEARIEPNSYTFVGLFKACSIMQDLDMGRRLHAKACQKGLASDSFVGSTLLGLYSKGGAIAEAEEVFCELNERDIVSWTSMMSAYIEHGQAESMLQLYRQMQDEGVSVDPVLYVISLQACTILAEGEEAVLVDQQPIKLRALLIGQAFHADVNNNGFATNTIVGTTLLNMYGKCGAMKETEAVFCKIAQHDLVSWRAMLSAYVELGEAEKALQLYMQMQEKGMNVEYSTYVIALKACALLGEREEAFSSKVVPSSKVVSLEIGEGILADIRRRNLSSDTFIGTALITMYGKCGMLVQAEAAFCQLSHRDVVSWTAMLSAYVEQGEPNKALQLFSLMHHEQISPDLLAFITAFQACASLAEKGDNCLFEGRPVKRKALEIGKALFADARMRGFVSDVAVSTALLSMYGKCGAIKEAEDVFLGLSHHNLLSWNAMLSAYVEWDQAEKAADLYGEMQKKRAVRNDATFLCALQACHNLGSLELCKQVHFEIVSSGFDQMADVVATLLHAYGSCASIVDAQVIFNEIPEYERDVVQWNAYISAYAEGGDTKGALEIYETMNRAQIFPNEATFVTVLLICCRSGLVIQGVQYFESMIRDYNLRPNLQHYGIMFDLLGRAGDFKRIEKMLNSMSMQAPMTIWLSLLASCRTHGNVELAKLAFKSAVDLQPELAAPYILMSNIFTEAGLQESAIEVEQHRQKNCG
ncbi:hypothetical protein GOP47_0006673 [Adiantum capillus-veneris]|uniref:Pentatricopeptide repeat-containing protein n=1 Tax=Adiantum capillus-veneris TaxID=13818 RepID=A0A9D4V4V9_ADICA|nr:hypothetical protein GOP47_0006673 [Adiantum capillus-veneris]